MSYWTKPDQEMKKLLQWLNRLNIDNKMQPLIDYYSKLDPNKKLTSKQIAELQNKLKDKNINVNLKRKVKYSEAAYYDFLVELTAIYIQIEEQAILSYQALAPNIDVKEFLSAINPWTGGTFKQDLENDKLYRVSQIQKEVARAYYGEHKATVNGKVLKKNLLRETPTQYAGLLDTYMTTIMAESTLKGLKALEYTKVIFKSVIDDRTTIVCRELNDTIINIKDLKAGVNQPPINQYKGKPLPHPCRSWLEGYSK